MIQIAGTVLKAAARLPEFASLSSFLHREERRESERERQGRSGRPRRAKLISWPTEASDSKADLTLESS